MWTSCSPSVAAATRFSPLIRNGFDCRAKSSTPDADKKKVVVVGGGWAGLGAAHHLSKQGLDVTLLHAGSCPAPEVGVKGFWYPYRNIFSVIDELSIDPFTSWTKSAHYSPEGLEVEYPIFQDLPRLPSPFAALLYPQFFRLPLVDLLTSGPLMAAVVDFDNTDTAWRKYDAMTARELFKQCGCSQSLYQKAFEPLVQVGLLAPAEQCSAAATLGMLYYYIIAHQKNFDMVWCRGTVQEKIFVPWMESIKEKGCKIHEIRTFTDFTMNEDTGCISRVLCDQEIYEADAFVLAVGVSALKSIVSSSVVLQSRKEFLNILNLTSVDVVSVKVWLDRKVEIPKAANVCFGFDDLTGWNFFNLNSIYDEYRDSPGTILEVEFYYASQLLPLEDEQIVTKVIAYLSRCIKELQEAIVVQQIVTRLPKSATHFFPGSYKYMMRGSTTFQNLFVSGDWVITRHGSWSQEKAYVTGLEAANRVVDYLGEGSFARIIPVEDDEPHIEALRNLNRNINEIRKQTPLSDYFLA